MKINCKRSLQVQQEERNDVNLIQTRLYHFPDINLLGKEFANVQQINNKLDLLLKDHNLVNSTNKIEKSLVIRQVEGGYIFKCKAEGCYAFLKFHFTSNGRLMLAKSDIEHQHKFNHRMSRNRLPKTKNFQIQECMDQLQLLDFRPFQVSNFIKVRFNIPKHQYDYVKNHRNRREPIKNMIMSLQKYEKEIFIECKDLQQLAAFYRNERLKPQKKQDKDVVIIVTRKMRDMYKKYHGEYVLFSIFPELVLETRFTKKMKYHHVGVLYGEDANGSVNLLFGVIFMRKSIRLAYLYIMEKLFNFLGKYPKVLITDYDPHLSQAIRRLQKRAGETENTIKLHLQLPNSFITNNFQSRTSPQFLSILSSELQGLLRETDRNKHQQRLKVIMEACSLNPPTTQDRIAEQILKYVKGNSIIYLPPLFIGLSVTSYSTATYLRSRVLELFKSPRPMILAVKAIFEIFKTYEVLKYLKKEQIQSRLNLPKDNAAKKEKMQLLAIAAKTYESTTRLKTVTKSLSQPAALCLYDSLERCFMGRIDINKQSTHHSYRAVQSPETFPYVISRVYEFHNNNKVKVWRCNCHYFAKTGLPCWHEIKVCLEEKASMMSQVSSFWLKNAPSNDKTTRSHLNPSPNAIEHDVKFWNEDATKLHEEREKLQPNRNGESKGSDHAFNNIKINGNENPDDLRLNQKDSQGLCDLINELNGIEWKENDELDRSVTWKDDFSNKSMKNNDNGFYYQDEDRNLENRSITNVFNNPPLPKQSKKNIPFSSKNANLLNLKANNYSNQNSYNRSEKSSSHRKLANDLKFLQDNDNDQLDSQWNQEENLSFNNYKQSEFYKDNGKKNEEWSQQEMIDENQEVMDEQIQGEEIVDKESEQNQQENSQQNSEEEWQRNSLDILSKVPTQNKVEQDALDFNIDDLNFDLDEEEDPRPKIKMHYQEIDSN